MAARSGASGPQGTKETRLPGTMNRPTAEQTAAQLLADGFGSASELSFMQGTASERLAYRSESRRQFLEGSLYVGQYRDWTDPEGTVRRIDYGLFNWLEDCCRTFIEAKKNQEADGGRSPIRSLPQPDGSGQSYFDALCYVGALWQTEDVLAISKSRRLIMSWFTRCADHWDILFHPGRELAIRCEDQGDSEKMVYRHVFLHDHIPSDKIARSCLPRMETVRSKDTSGTDRQYNRVTIKHSEHEPGAMDSFILAISKNSDQRGDGFARITVDEAAKQRDLRRLWPGLMGTRIGESGTTDSGQVVLVSTPVLESFMDYLIHEKDMSKA